MNILICPDKFKGTLSATAAAKAIARGWRKARAHDPLVLLPMSDGGDGFGEIVGRALEARIQNVETVDAAHRLCPAQWWWEPKKKIAVIESAAAIGLAKLPVGKFHPFDLDTFGLGAVIRAAAKKGARRCLIGIGGSATNDGGFGLARALGWKFLDHSGNQIERWTELRTLACVVPPKRRRWFRELIVAVDVQNPLLGPRGATRVYGPQKGLRPFELQNAETNLCRLATTCSSKIATIPGSGAAGGLGFGLMTFLGAKPQAGFDLFAHIAKLQSHLREVDLVITGEGCVDRSTIMGKGVGEIARRCHKLNIPCIALAGGVSASSTFKIFTEVHAMTELTTVKKAKANPAVWLERLAEQAALHF